MNRLAEISENANFNEWRIVDANDLVEDYYSIYLDKDKGKQFLEIRLQQKAYDKNRLKTNIQYKLCCNLRSRLYKAINRNFKAGSAVRDLGCTVEELKPYLESKFQPGMTWDNWTTDGWHIDHKIPLRDGGADKIENMQALCKCCHSVKTRMEAHERSIVEFKIEKGE